jgi:hemerythrin
MNRTNTETEIVEQIMHEHDALRDKVQRIHAVLAEPAPAQDEIEELLREFLTTLVIHFSNEEDEGFFSEVTAYAPQLADRAGKLCVEHRQMLHDANELCRFAAAGCPSMPWWRELNSRCHEFSKRLMLHEVEEHKLLHESRLADI